MSGPLPDQGRTQVTDPAVDRRLHRRSFLAAAAAFTAAARAATAFAAARRSRRHAAGHRWTVVLDPGHGGVDPGAISITGALEKDIVLATAHRTRTILARSPAIRIYLTRDADEFIPLHERVARARGLRADLFLSIHADSLPDPRKRGASVFTLSESASDEYAAQVAARENKADLLAGLDLSRQPDDVGRILLDLARRRATNASIQLARRIVHEFRRDIVVLDPCHRTAGFVVLKTLGIPSVLVEIGCLSNHREDRNLRSARYQRRIARDLARAVEAYCKTAS